MDETIVLGAGCFWCTEAVFSMFKGIIKTMPGYAGGTTRDPSYDQVAYEGNPGKHTEVLQIEYDPDIISLGKILEIFFKMHDPTSNDFQDVADYGVAYRSLILYNTDAQKKVIEKFIEGQRKNYKKPIVTMVKKLDKFYPAEDYHKDYYKKNPIQPYCLFVTRPKVNKIKKEFGV